VTNVQKQDCEAYRFQGDTSGWSMTGSLEAASKSSNEGGAQREESALNMFRQMDLRGSKSRDDTKLTTVHQNTISTMRVLEESGGGHVRRFSSEFLFPPFFALVFGRLLRFEGVLTFSGVASGVDGRVVIWTI